MVAIWKKDQVKSLKKKFKNSGTIGIVRIEGIPSKQFQQIRKTLRGDVDILIAKRRVVEHSLKKSGHEGLVEYLDGSIGIITSDLDPFQLEKKLDGCRSNAPAKAGSLAPFDIIVPAGDTGLPAGPVIGDLQGAGLKAKIQGGKILLQEESTIVKEGEIIDEKKAAALMRLKIEPMEIGMDLKAVWENGMVYPYEILHIDAQETLDKLASAHQKAFNLAYNAQYFTKDTVLLLMQEAFNNARNLAFNSEVINKETVEYFISKAGAQAAALKSCLPEDLKVEEKPNKEDKPEADTPDSDDKGPDKEDKKEEAGKKEEEKLEEKKEKEKKPEEKPAEEKKEKATEEKTEEKPAETKEKKD